MSGTFSPTASKVARKGAKNPYPTPPRMLPTIPMTGHRIRGTGKTNSTTILRINPILLVLRTPKETEEKKT